MLIAVPLTEEKFNERTREAVEKGADIIEIRADQFENPDPEKIEECVRSVQSLGTKAILTVRSPKEGGREVEGRIEIFRRVSPISDYTDLELSSKDLLPEVKEIVHRAGKRLILSFHDFGRTPPAWIIREVIREALRHSAVPKVAVMARTEEDVLRLLCAGGEVKGEKILIAMGEAGKISRLCAFVAGSTITYCSLGRALAPGQIPVEEMVKLRELFIKAEGK